MSNETILVQETKTERVGALETSTTSTIYGSDGFDYQAEAQQTESDKFHGNLVDASYFYGLLNEIITSLNKLDIVKKALFYGKENSEFKPVEDTGFDDISMIVYGLFGTDPLKARGIIHSIIGKATEAGEQIEILKAVIFECKPFDVTNFKEEIGDGQWYDAIGLNAVGSTIEEVQRTNIAKLRARYPEKFTEYDAQNRNLVAERKILEA